MRKIYEITKFFPRKATGCIGVYITKERIFLAWLKPDASGAPVVGALLETAINPGIVKAGVIIDPVGFSQLIKKFYSDNAIETREIMVSIWGAETVTKIVEFPFMSRPETIEALKGEVDKYVTFSGVTPLIDFFRIDKQKLCFIALGEKVSASILAAFDAAGLDLKAIEILPLSIARLFLFDNKDFYSQNTVMFVFIAASLDINIISKGVLRFSHNLEEFEPDKLIHEIKMAAAYWEEQFPKDSLAKVIVFSDTSQDPGFLKSLSQAAGIDAANGVTKLISGQASDFLSSKSAAIGVALRKWQKSALDINFVPEKKLRRDTIKKNSFLVFISISAVLTVWFILNLMLSSLFSIYQKKLVPVEGQLGAYDNILIEVGKINAKREYFNRGIKMRKKFINSLDIISLGKILDDLTRFIPAEVWLERVSFSPDGKITLEGKAFFQDAVYKYVNLLKYSAYLQEAKLTLIQAGGEGERQIAAFNINCRLIRKPDTKSEVSRMGAESNH